MSNSLVLPSTLTPAVESLKKTESHIASAMVHWADLTAQRLIQQLGDRSTTNDHYTLASGITPSGVVHFGNFREVMTVELVARALRDRGQKVRFIFSWDDYDTFRKIPKNMPQQELLETFLFKPIVDTPDPFGEHESYAAHHEKNFESQLKKMGIEVEPLYQATKYRTRTYVDSIKQTLDEKNTIKAILDKFRSTPLADDWWPLSMYCENCDRDKTTVDQYNSDNQTIHYSCQSCGHEATVNLSETTRVKLPWRMDWPMRWAFEKVDFEPGGKDHSSGFSIHWPLCI